MQERFRSDAGPGLSLTDSEPLSVDAPKLRSQRLARLRDMMREKQYAAVLLFDPNNQRYATGSRNMFGYFLRNSTRYFFVPTEGPIILFEYPQSAHVSTSLETVQEARNSRIVWSSVGGRDTATAKPFAEEIAALVLEYGRGSTKIGLDRCGHLQALALEGEGLEVTDCQQEILHVRRIKTDEEIACLRLSMAAAEFAVAAVREAVKPGISEQELFALMYGEVIRQGGELVETRLLTSEPARRPLVRRVEQQAPSGPADYWRSIPMSSDASAIFPTSRARFVTDPRAAEALSEDAVPARLRADPAQRRHHQTGPQLSRSRGSRPGKSAPFVERRYTSVMHGVGLHGETPFIAHARDFATYGSHGVLEPGMVVSVESYIGEVGGAEGVKLEEEVLITETGHEVISRFPFEEDLIGREL